MHMSKINVNNLSFGDCCDGGCKGMRRPKLLEVPMSVMGGLRSGFTIVGANGSAFRPSFWPVFG